MNKFHFFSYEQGNFFVRLILAHILVDFVLQSKTMVENKSWFSKHMMLHIALVFLSTFLFTFSFGITAIITISHWLIDSLKISLDKQNKFNKRILFIGDQLLHLLVIVFVFFFHFCLFDKTYNLLITIFTDYKLSLITLSYAIVVYPLGYLIKFSLQKITSPNTNSEAIEHGGKLIGEFERIIILTFVLINQYEAIGFLITGKSIMRFADKNPELKSEYVLVGTMMSYALTIIIGIIANQLIQ